MFAGIALILQAAAAPALPPSPVVESAVEPAYVLVAFAGDRQVGFVDPAAIRASGPERRFTTVWVYTPPEQVGPHLVHRSERQSIVDCGQNAIGEQEARFFGEGPAPLFLETRSTPPQAVSARSASEDVVNFVCAGKEPYPDLKVSRGLAEAAAMAHQIASHYRDNPTR